MESVDRKSQWLKENYAHMTEDELCAVAKDAYDLTEIAREALQAVITERGFTVRLNLERPALSPVDDDEGLINFKWPDNVEHAWRWMQILTAAGIRSFLGPDNVMHLEEFQGKFDGPVSLKVRDVDQDRAYAAVARAWERADQARTKGDGNKEEPEEEKAYAILCPKCHSTQVVLQGREPELKDPHFTAKFQWSCDACGHQWVDEGITQEAAGGQSWPGEEFSSRRGPFRRVDPKWSR
jgi:DNA-directed RNA polymerase subunit M/transcription elongation factor TFIIS